MNPIQHIPAKTSPFALWWHINNSPAFKDCAVYQQDLYRFLMTIIDYGGKLTNNQSRPLIVYPKDIDINTMKLTKQWSFFAKRRFNHLLEQLPKMGLNKGA